PQHINRVGPNASVTQKRAKRVDRKADQVVRDELGGLPVVRPQNDRLADVSPPSCLGRGREPIADGVSQRSVAPTIHGEKAAPVRTLANDERSGAVSPDRGSGGGEIVHRARLARGDAQNVARAPALHQRGGEIELRRDRAAIRLDAYRSGVLAAKQGL